MAQTREDRAYRYFQALRRSSRYRGFRHDHYAKGWCHGPHMEVARTFGIPIRTVKEIIAARRVADPENN